MTNIIRDCSKKSIRLLQLVPKKIIFNLKYGRNTVIFSLGENCLTDDVLSRNRIKSFSSPYSFGKSNIEYILFFEKEQFKDFLNPKYLKYYNLEGKKVVRNTKIVKTKNNYDSSVTNGYEFTHFDVISNQKLKDKMLRRCNRLLKLHNKKIYMVYNYRICNNINERLLKKHFSELKKIYTERNNDVEIYIFTQKIISKKEERRIEKTKIENGIYKYVLYTLNEWKGNNKEIFWAKCDDDLLKTMIQDIKASVKSKRKKGKSNTTDKR